MTGTELRRPRIDPLDCGQGCYPPHTPMYLGSNPNSPGSGEYCRANQTWDHRPGDRWVCEHGAAYEAYDPSNHYIATTYRSWRRLGWTRSWFARRAANKHKEPK